MTTPEDARRLYHLKRRLHEVALGAQSSAEVAARTTAALARDAQGHFLRAIENLSEGVCDAGDLEMQYARARVLSRRLDAARAAAQVAADKAEAQRVIARARSIESEQMKRWEELTAEDARAEESRRDRIREDELGAQRRCR
ncbi:MAG: hypothetical protein U0414_03620 [Polyangiaceae bacterium]